MVELNKAMSKEGSHFWEQYRSPYLQAKYAGTWSQLEFVGSEAMDGNIFSSSFIPIPGTDGKIERITGVS